jgi:hypothetical protein
MNLQVQSCHFFMHARTGLGGQQLFPVMASSRGSPLFRILSYRLKPSQQQNRQNTLEKLASFEKALIKEGY